MLFLHLLLVGAQGQTPVDRVELPAPDGAYVVFEADAKRPTFYLSKEGTSFFCDVPAGTKGTNSKLWQRWAAYLEQIADTAPANPDADWGWLKTGIGSSQMVGYCNAIASTRDGRIMLSVFHNRACFGSAGCNKDQITLLVTPDYLRAMAAQFRAHDPKRK